MIGYIIAGSCFIVVLILVISSYITSMIEASTLSRASKIGYISVLSFPLVKSLYRAKHSVIKFQSISNRFACHLIYNSEESGKMIIGINFFRYCYLLIMKVIYSIKNRKQTRYEQSQYMKWDVQRICNKYKEEDKK